MCSSGVIDREEFEAILNLIKQRSRQTNLSRGGMRTGLNAGEK